MANDHIYLWFTEYLNGDISDEDLKQLNNWLEASSDNRLLFEQVQRMWKLTGKISVDLNLNVDAAWINTKERLPDIPKNKYYLFSPPWYRAAAVLLLIAATTAIFYFNTSSDSYERYETGAQETEKITLPDGSIVWLNENSNLSYDVGFMEQHRNLELTGEAFFEVTKDLEQAFVVHTAALRTTVLGTSFNVKEDREIGISEVVVMNGKVGVSLPEEGGEIVLLTPGSMARYDHGSTSIDKFQNQNHNFLAWRDKKLVFENTTLQEIQVTLENYFKVPIQIDNMDIATCQLTSNFDDPTLEEVLDVIALTLNVSYEKVQDTYLITGEGCKVSP